MNNTNSNMMNGGDDASGLTPVGYLDVDPLFVSPDYEFWLSSFTNLGNPQTPLSGAGLAATPQLTNESLAKYNSNNANLIPTEYSADFADTIDAWANGQLNQLEVPTAIAVSEEQISANSEDQFMSLLEFPFNEQSNTFAPIHDPEILPTFTQEVPSIETSSIAPENVQESERHWSKKSPIMLVRYMDASSEDECEAPFEDIERNIDRFDSMSPNFPSPGSVEASSFLFSDASDSISTHSNSSQVSLRTRSSCLNRLRKLGPFLTDRDEAGGVSDGRFVPYRIPGRTPSIRSYHSNSSIRSDATAGTGTSATNANLGNTSRAPNRRKRAMTNSHKPTRQTRLESSSNRFFCTFCGTSFSTKSTWKRHEESIHLMLKTWTCSPQGITVPITPSPSTASYTQTHTTDPANPLSACLSYKACFFCAISSTSTQPGSIPCALGTNHTHQFGNLAADIHPSYAILPCHQLETHVFSHPNAATCHENSTTQKTFIRYDHFTRHLRDAHKIMEVNHSIVGTAEDDSQISPITDLKPPGHGSQDSTSKTSSGGASKAINGLASLGCYTVLPGPTKSRCGFCNEQFINWSDRVHHLAHEFHYGKRTMEEWRGDWGFDEYWMSRIQDARQPEVFSGAVIAAEIRERESVAIGIAAQLDMGVNVNAGNGGGGGMFSGFDAGVPVPVAMGRGGSFSGSSASDAPGEIEKILRPGTPALVPQERAGNGRGIQGSCVLKIRPWPAGESTLHALAQQRDTPHIPGHAGAYGMVIDPELEHDASRDITHTRFTHRFTCDFKGCGRGFCLRKDLIRHKQTIHANDKPEFFCPVENCKRNIRGFSRKDNLRYHIVQLHGEKIARGWEAVEKAL